MIYFVFGNRTFNDTALLDKVLTDMYIVAPIDAIWSGGAAGADRLAEEWARKQGIPARIYPAEWDRPDGSFDRSAGVRRSAQLITDLPRDARAVAFTDVKFPTADWLTAHHGQIRDCLSAGTRASIGLCLEAGIDCWAVFSDGHVLHIVRSAGTRTREVNRRTAAERLDAVEGETDLGELGLDASASTGHTINRFAAAPRAKVGVRHGELQMIGGKWMRATVSRDGLEVIWKPAETKPLGGGTRSRGYRYDNAPRGHGDGERRGLDNLQGKTAFVATGAEATCRMCGDPHHGDDDLCSSCLETICTH